jgi:glutamate racemase
MSAHSTAFFQAISRYLKRANGTALGYNRPPTRPKRKLMEPLEQRGAGFSPLLPDANEPIGIFDSGMGGLTVARCIAEALPHESIYYVGDTKRCPYGVREPHEIRTFVRQIGAWFAQRRVKLVVIACNTATAAALPLAQRTFGVPVIGVIAPGARAAVQATVARQVGVIATPLTVQSDAYAQAIRQMDAGVAVHSLATPRFVGLVERELATGRHLHEDWRHDRDVFMAPEIQRAVAQDLAPLLARDIDTLVLGCTHFPLLTPAIRAAFGRPINIVSSAEETTREVGETLDRRDQLARAGGPVRHRFATTSDDITAFAAAGAFIFGRPLASIERIDLAELAAIDQP